jgi:menaquinone-dependent protoporphyrinogen oxidase
MPRVLVAHASRHGSTAEIAEAIGAQLRGHRLEVDVRAMHEVDTVYPYDAYVLGSAVYMGSWLREARHFVDEHYELISTRPAWIFSSGPIGDPPSAGAETFDATDLTADLHAVEHKLFDGRLDHHALRLGERALTRAMRVPDGDYRDWAAISSWADEIARTIALVSAG